MLLLPITQSSKLALKCTCRVVTRRGASTGASSASSLCGVAGPEPCSSRSSLSSGQLNSHSEATCTLHIQLKHILATGHLMSAPVLEQQPIFEIDMMGFA